MYKIVLRNSFKSYIYNYKRLDGYSRIFTEISKH